MNKTPKWLRWLTIVRSYEPGEESQELIQNALSARQEVPEDASFVIKAISSSKIKALAKVSMGTMYISSGRVFKRNIEGIHAYLETEDNLVYIYTKPRWEYLFFLGVFMFFITALIGSGEVSEGLPIISGIMAVVFIWFRFIYRFQEKRLIYQLEEYFKLVDHEQA